MRDRDHDAGKALQIILQNRERWDIQVIGGLVQQQHIGGGGQDGKQKQSPLFPAGEFADGAPLYRLLEQELLQQLGRRDHAVRGGDPVADLLDVVDDSGIPIHIRHLLAEVADAHGLPDLDLPPVRTQRPGDQVQQRGLSAAVDPHDPHPVVPQKPAAEVPQDGARAEGLRNPAQFDGLLSQTRGTCGKFHGSFFLRPSHKPPFPGRAEPLVFPER